MKNLGAVASPKGKPSTDKAHCGKQVIRKNDNAQQQEYVNKHPVDHWRKHNHHTE